MRKDEYDVIVLGGGLAGHCAALAAAEAGASVLMVEKADQCGGSTVLSGGFMAFADTLLQRALGFQDTPEQLLEDLCFVGGAHVQHDLLRAYADEQASVYDWLVSKGVRFDGVELASGQSVARSHATDPGAMIAILHNHVRTNPSIHIRTRTIAVQLCRASDGGRICGVQLEEGGRLETVLCRAGVIIATGGFSRSESLLQTFAPRQSRAVRLGGGANTGDGLRMAWHHGADMRDMGEVKGTYGVHAQRCADGQEILLMFYRGAIIVNSDGRRFVDESLSYKLIGDAALQQRETLSWQIFDQKIFEESLGAARLFDAGIARNRGLLVSANSIEALAVACGIDPAVLSDTLHSYNDACRHGTDLEFGRDGLCHHVGDLVPLDTPPYHAYPSTVAVLATYCGVRVDVGCRVVDVYDEVIDGLYAAGEVTGGFHGNAYMTGSSLGKAAVFGRRAGREAAREAHLQHAGSR